MSPTDQPSPTPSTRAGGFARGNLDAFIATHEHDWQRLARLVSRGSSPARLGSDELDELVRLHLRVSSHLSTARTHLGDPELAAHLSSLVSRSSALVHGTRRTTLTGLLAAFTRTFPAAVWHARHAIGLAAVVFVASLAAVAAWLATTPEAVAASAPEAVREAYVQRDFEAYYSSEPGSVFAARVFTNNAAVGAMAFGAGAAWGVPTVGVLVLNGVNVGIAAGLFHAAGDAARFWSLILPHGLLELTAVFVAGGAGLRLGWASISPGERTRREALAEEGRRSVVIVMGLVPVFLVAGLLEGLVTPRPWAPALRVGIGAVVWAGVCGWLVVAGRAAARRGLTGALGESVGTAGPPAN